MQYHKAVQDIQDLLEAKGIEYKFFEHEAVRTSEEAAAQRPEYELKQGAKAIIVKATMPGKENKFVMAVFPADQRLDAKKFKKVVGAKKTSFATAEEASEITGGVEFGGIPPFGNLFGIDVIVDPTLSENEEIIFNCGDRRTSIAMKSKDYLSIVKPRIENIV